MIHAYNHLYLSDAKNNLATMFDYAINACGYPADDFSMLFTQSGVAEFFECGNPSYVSGMSGYELVYCTFDYLLNPPATPRPVYMHEKSPEYWAGYYLAEYQWFCSRSFLDIFIKIPFSEIVEMYHPYHEMDVVHFICEMERRYNERSINSKLKQIRESCNLSQSQLATLSGVNIRNIQLYEQGVNDINKAQGITLCKLAKILHCNVEDLLEFRIDVDQISAEYQLAI